MTSSIRDRYLSVVDRAAEAATRAGRAPCDVTILVATKTFGADAIRELLAAGARDIGENYVQEAAEKARDLGAAAEDLRWHMIGRLQRNKAKSAVALFHLVHSLDRLDLARAIDRAAANAGTTATCLVEVNVGGENSKGGVSPERSRGLLESVSSLGALRIRGLMAIPAPGRVDDSRRSFVRLYELREQLLDLRLANVQLNDLSMGMSGDFEAAIEEGATIVRVGTAILGPRTR